MIISTIPERIKRQRWRDGEMERWRDGEMERKKLSTWKLRVEMLSWKRFDRDGQTGTARLAKKVKAFSVYKKHTWTWLWRKDSEGRLQGHFFSVPPATPPSPRTALPPLSLPPPPQIKYTHTHTHTHKCVNSFKSSKKGVTPPSC